jgi:hypothetical protein
MKRFSVLVVMCLAIAALAVVRLWPNGGPEYAGAGSHITLHPRDVRGMPVLWLGDNYDSNHDGTPDMRLTSTSLEDSPEFRDPRDGRLIKPGTKSYSMAYGSCVPPTPLPGNEQWGCAIPLSIDFYSVCNTPPLSNKDIMPRVRIRGVDAYEFIAGGLWLETANFTISVGASWGKTSDEARAHVRQVVEDLIGANPEAAAFTKGTAFAQRTDAAVPQPCAQITSAPDASSCCSLQLDMDPGTAGVQASRRVIGSQDISIDIVLGDNVGNLSAFNFSLVYDDTRLTPVAAASGGLNGNPDFNEIALSDTWNCGLGGSPSADTDAATGPGHGVALLSCFTTAQGATISTPTVIATLQLHVAASGTSSITIDDADFSRYDGTSIGTCVASSGGTMICTGGSVTVP